MSTLEATKTWFELAVPEPKIQNKNTQLGVHIEEVAEMLDSMVGTTSESYAAIRKAREAMKQLATVLKTPSDIELVEIKNHVETLDALCDQIVTAVGVAHMQGYNIIGAMKEVNGSNYSKFVDGKPVFEDNQKIKKGPDYYKAVLEPYLV